MRGNVPAVLHGSDSGADLSECGGHTSLNRDVDWEQYWTVNGERLIWESWISKYGSYINPDYLATIEGQQTCVIPEDSNANDGCTLEDQTNDPSVQHSFQGMFPCVKKDDSEPSYSLQSNTFQPTDPSLLPRRHNSFGQESSRPKSVSMRSEGHNDVFEDIERKYQLEGLNLELNAGPNIKEGWHPLSPDEADITQSVYSKNSEDELLLLSGQNSNGADSVNGSVAKSTVTTDSMTNVTRLTMSSFDCDMEESGRSNSGTSSENMSSQSSHNSSESDADLYWQQLWKQHFNEQYYAHYNAFVAMQKDGSGNVAKAENVFLSHLTVEEISPRTTSSIIPQPLEEEDSSHDESNGDLDNFVHSMNTSEYVSSLDDDNAKDDTDFKHKTLNLKAAGSMSKQKRKRASKGKSKQPYRNSK